MKVELERAVVIQVMQENVILVYYAKIWKFGPKLPKMEFSKFFIFLERSPNFASNEPSTTPDIKFKSSYARKRDYVQIWKFSPRLPKMEFSKFFIFLKRSPDFASNEPSTTPRH